MLRTLGAFFADKVRRWLPDSLSFAIILTFVAMLMAVTITGTKPSGLVHAWYKGFWLFLEFSMQMALIVVLGYAVGTSPVLARFFDWLGKRAKTPFAVYVMVLAVGSITAYVYWGFNVATAVLAMHLAQRVPGVDYRFLGACVYASLMPTAFGISISAPLLMNTPGNKFIQLGLVDRTIPPSETMFSDFNLLALLISIAVIFATMLLMRPRKADPRWDIAAGGNPCGGQGPEVGTRRIGPRESLTPAERIDRSPLLAVFVCICGFSYIIYYFVKNGSGGINLNSINFIFFMCALAFWGRPTLFVGAVLGGVRGAGHIMVQFPFYAGIMGIFMFTGLSKVMAQWMVSFANEVTFPWFSFLTACIANMFIPSAGGEWLVVGPTLLEASTRIGYPVGKLIMAYSYGDMLTNLIQPFWTLIFIPVLASIADIRARDIMGYTAVLCMVWFVVLSLIVLLL